MAKYIVILPSVIGFSERNQDLAYAYSRIDKEGGTEAASPQEAVKNVFWRGFSKRSNARFVLADLARRGIRLADMSDVYLVDEVLDANTMQPVRDRNLRELCEECYLASAIAERRGGHEADYFDEARRLLDTHFRRPDEAKKPVVRETLF